MLWVPKEQWVPGLASFVDDFMVASKVPMAPNTMVIVGKPLE